MQYVMRVGIGIVNFVRKRGSIYCQFQIMMEENTATQIMMHWGVRWLRRGSITERMYQLRNELTTFVRENTRKE